MTLGIREADRTSAIRSSAILTPDWVQVGYETWGEVPPLVLIHGAFSDQRTNWNQVREMLAGHVAGYAMSRRGRGETDKTVDHELDDEIADAAALIRAIDEPVAVLGHSYGALVALGAAAREPSRVRKLVLYEPPSPGLFGAETLAPLDRLAEAGDWEGMTLHFFRDVLSVPASELAAAQGTQEWRDAVADAPASLVDLHRLARHRFDPEEFRTLEMPVLLQIGTESPPELYATEALQWVLRNFRVGRLVGEAHEAMTTAPDLYARALLEFLLDAE